MTQTSPPPKGLTFIVAMLTMIGPFTIDTYLPAFPAIEDYYGVGRAMLSHSVAVYLLAFAFATLMGGAMADRFGRRIVILGALSVYLVASLGCALADDYILFLLFRLLQGLASGAALVASRALVRDIFSPQDAQKVVSRIMMLFILAPAISPILGGWLSDTFGWQSIFYFLTVFCALVFIAVLTIIPETLNPAHRQSFHPKQVALVYGRTLTDRRFVCLSLCLAFFFSSLFLYIIGSPTLIFDFLGLDSSDFGLLFIPMVGGIILGAWISSHAAHRWPPERTATLTLAIILTGALLNTAQVILLEPQPFTSIAPLVIISTGVGLGMPAFSILAIDCFPKNRGSAAGMQGFMQTMSNALITSAAIPFLILQPIYLVLGQLTLVTLAVGLWLLTPKAEETPL